jgi:hypothetical protein
MASSISAGTNEDLRTGAGGGGTITGLTGFVESAFDAVETGELGE